MSDQSPIVVIGFKGCGKSKIGKALAMRMGLDFFDTDTMIEDLHMERTKQSLDFRGIYTEHGSEYFDSLELEVLKRSGIEKTGCVISFGGGSLIKVNESGLPIQNATFVYITVEDDLLFNRIIVNGIPAFFDKENPRGSFDRLMLERTPVYEKYADIIVDNTGKPPDKVVDDIMERLKARR